MTTEDKTAHPFQPGARVARYLSRGGFHPVAYYREDFVEKIHKTGRFTLRGDRYRQYGTPNKERHSGLWSAISAHGDEVVLWNSESDMVIVAANRRDMKSGRLQAVILRVSKLERPVKKYGHAVDEVPVEALDKIEEGLAIAEAFRETLKEKSNG